MKYILTILLSIGCSSLLPAQTDRNAQINLESAYRMDLAELSINESLEGSNISIGQYSSMPLLASLECFVNRFSIELGLGLSVNRGNGYKAIGMPTMAKLKYNFQGINLSLGVACAYETTSLSLYNNGSELDLNAGLNSSFSQLYNSRTSLGPVASYQHQLFEWLPIRWTFGYMIGITSSSWKSEYAKLTNNISERKNNSLYVSASIPIKIIKRKNAS